MEKVKKTKNNILNLFFLTDSSPKIIGAVYDVGEMSIKLFKSFNFLYDTKLEVSI